MRLGRPAMVAAAAVTAGLLVPLTSTPASAETPAERLWTITDSNDDVDPETGFGYGLRATDVPGGGQVFSREQADAAVYDVTASGDGSRIAYVRESASGQELVVRDMSTRFVKAVRTVSPTSPVIVGEPALSPSGKVVAWSEFTFTSSGPVLKTMRATVGGAPTQLLLGYGVLAFADESSLLVQSLQGVNRLAVGGTLKPVPGLPSDALQVALSGDGSKIAWVEDTSPTTTALKVGTFDRSTATVAGTRTLASTLDNEQPAFSRDGATVYWSQYDPQAGAGSPGALGSILSRPYDASAAATTVLTGADHVDVAVTGLPSADTTDPAAPTLLPAGLLGTKAELRWAMPQTEPQRSELSGIEITRAGASPVFVPSSFSKVLITGLTRGQTYTFTLTAVDRSGRKSAPVTKQLTALQAVSAQFADPISNTSTTPRFRVAYGAGGPSSATWLVDYLASGTSTWKPWITDVHAAGTRVFGSAAATGVNATTSVPGTSYSFRTKVVDAYGNATPYVNVTRRAVVPYDQTAMLLSGGVNRVASHAYLGSYRRLSQPTHKASITFTGNRFQLVGIKCSACGRFKVFDNGTYVGTFDSYSSTKKVRAVLYTRYVTGKHTITIKPVGTAGRPYVFLDGVAIRR